jgi:hypothetical protein
MNARAWQLRCDDCEQWWLLDEWEENNCCCPSCGEGQCLECLECREPEADADQW